MKDPILFRRSDCLSADDCQYWKDLLYRVTKIGTEMEVALPKGASRPVFEAEISQALAPSGSVEQLGRYGVLDVGPEHSGIEIRVIGRQPYFSALRREYDAICRILLEKGARPRPTCGLHYHLLTPGLAEPVPEIILSNLWNLVRRYAPELRFLTSSGNSRAGLCRRRTHCSHLEMVRHSPGTMTMAEIQQILRQSRIVPEHQNFMNLEHLQFGEEGRALPFHVEFRFPDADLCAVSITAKTFLFLALLIKAVDMSQYGVIHVGKIDAWRRKTMLLDLLSNNDGDLASSDTREISDAILEELRSGLRELFGLLGPTFDRFEDDGALDVLLAMADTPISLLRCAGYEWSDIEAYLQTRVHCDPANNLDEIDRRLMRHIDLGESQGLDDPISWQCQAAGELFLTHPELERRLERLQTFRGLRWDPRQGTMIFTR